MLQTIRDRMSGPIVWGIIGFLVLLFAVWGIGVQSFIGGGGDPTVVEVGDVKITQTEFQRAYDRAYQQLAQSMGDSFNPDQLDLPAFRERVLDEMIRSTLLDQYASREGYRTSDHALFDALTGIPQFQKDGRFSADAYRQTLANNGMTPEQFEKRMRDSLRTEQLQRTVLDTALIVPKQAQAAWRISHQTRDFSSAVFAPAQFADDVKIDDAAVKARYEKNKNQYIAPQKVKLAYIELAQSQLKPVTPPDQDVLKAIYDAQKDARFSAPEERHAQHILIPFGADPEAAHKQAESIAKKIADGGDFAALAKEYSKDPGSKSKGGDLGWVRPGMMDPAFEKALFALDKPGDVSAPVKTRFGWHIIKLDGIRPKHTLAFDDPEVQKQLIDTFDSQEAAKRFKDASDKLSELAFENPTSLEPVAKALGLQVQTSDWITRDGGTGVLANKAVVNAAFSDDVLKNGDNSKPVQVGPADLVVVRKVDEQAAHPLSFDDVKAKIRDVLVQEAENAKAAAAAQALLKDARGGEAFDAAAKKAGATVTSLDAVTRDNQALGKQLLDGVFSLPAPQDKQSSYGVVPLDAGKVAVVAVSAVHEPAPQPIGSETPAFTTAARGLNQSLAGAEFDAYRAYMESVVKVDREAKPKVEAPVGPDQ